ncbi:ATP-binding protein [Halobaculum sp. EA56]|uniref:ATP-binding protein n=1 Tax=Halobaculum sp. EA56 TaxID=3421648 RepID=UPI003EC0CF43
MNTPSAGDQLALKPGGILVAAVGFALTRVVLADTVFGSGMRMSITAAGEVLPLALGLGAVLYGVNLAVSTRSRRYARTVASWFLLGAVGLAATVAVALSAAPGGVGGPAGGTVVASVVLAGGAGGVVVGVRSAEATRHREAVRRQTERATVLNRMLRHEIRNGLTAVRGHTELLLDGEESAPDRSRAAVAAGLDRIERAVAETAFLVDDGSATGAALGPVRLDEVLGSCLDRRSAAGPRRPDALPSVSVRADDHAGRLFGELLALPERSGDPCEATLDVSVADHTVAVTVAAPGSWLAERERTVLVEGVPRYEHNDVDHGIPVVRLLATGYGGTVAVEEADDRTAVRVELPRTGRGVPPGDSPGIPAGTLWATLGAGVVAGVAMGGVLQAATGSLSVVGALYGTAASGPGWLAHLFHSAVFATLFVVAVSKSPRVGVDGSASRAVALGVAYGVLLWLLAAGVVMSLWLNATGIETPLPNLTAASLVGHLVWGVVVGASYPFVADVRSASPLDRLRAAVGDRFASG